MSILRTIRRRYSTLGEGVGEGDKGRGSLPIYPSLPSRIRPLPLPFRFVWQNKQTKKKKSYFMSYLQLYFLILSHCLDIKSGFDIGLESWLQIQSVCAHYDDIVSGEINPFVVFTHGWHSQDGKKCCFEIGVSFNFPSLVVVLFFGGELFLLLRPITNPYWVFITRFNIIIHAD